MDPTIRLYEMSTDYHVPINFQVFKLDIEASNTQNEIVMDMWFDFRREFELYDLSPKSHFELTQQLLLDNKKASLFKQFQKKKDQELTCDQICQKRAFCSTFSSLVDQQTICNGLDASASVYEFYDLIVFNKG